MPTRTCGRKNCSPRLKQVEDSLAPGKSRTGNLQLPIQIHDQNKMNMLHIGIPRKLSVLVEASRPSGSSSRRHASDFNPGSVTFVGSWSREYGGWVHV